MTEQTIRSVTMDTSRAIDSSGFGGEIMVPVRYEYQDGSWYDDWMPYDLAVETLRAHTATATVATKKGS